MNVFKQLYKSMYSPKDIAAYRNQGIGKTIMYIFLLTLLSILPALYHFSTAINDVLKAAEQVIQDEVPDFTIKDGILRSETNTPVTIEREGFTFTLDPTGAVTGDDLSRTENAIGLLKDELVLSAGGRVQSYPYSLLDASGVTKQDFLDFISAMNGMKLVILFIVFIFIYLVSSAMKFVEVSILALFGLMLKNMGGNNLKYGQLWRMAAYGVTISTVFFTIMEAVNTPVPSGFIINWLVSAIVLYLAIKEIPRADSAS